MSIIAWITFGLIPGFLGGALAAHYRQTARVPSTRTDSFFERQVANYPYSQRQTNPWIAWFRTRRQSAARVTDYRE